MLAARRTPRRYVPAVSAKLYQLSFSHPCHAAQAMLQIKGIEHERVNLPLGAHPAALRLAGFSGRTVPALKIEGRKVQGSKEIARCLDEIEPEPPLFPAETREAVEEAEAWGERELQPLPRRFFRWGLATQNGLRKAMVEETAGLPGPAAALAAPLMFPMTWYFARLSRADDSYTREGVERLPELLDHADALIREGTIGRPGRPNAADFQIASTVAVLRGFPDLKPVLEGRPCLDLAATLFPREPDELPSFIPQDWLPR
jgi:glutathione S-transferase